MPGGHVRDDDAVAGLQSLCNLNAVVGRLTEENLDAGGLRAVIGHFEEGKRVASVRLEGPLDESGLRNFLDIDGTASGEIGARFAGLWTNKLQVDADGAVLHIGINVEDLGGIGVILQGDGGSLIDFDAAGLGFRDVDTGHETFRIGNTGKNGAWADLLPDANGDFLKDAAHASANEESCLLLGAQSVEGLHLGNFGLFGGQLSLAGFCGYAQSFAFDLQASGERVCLGVGNFRIHDGAELSLKQGLVTLCFKICLGGIGLKLRFQGLFVEKLGLKLNAEVGEFGFGFFHGELRIYDLAVEIGIAEFQNNGVGSYVGAGAQEDLVDMAVGAGGEPAHIFRDKSAQAINAAGHGT